MAKPLSAVLRRGAVFLWTEYSKLDDPALAGQTKPKYMVILSTSPQDDPIIYILTTSEKADKPRHTTPLFPEDLVRVPAGTYPFFPKDTIINVSETGQLDVERDTFEDRYNCGTILFKGRLTPDDVNGLMQMIDACPRVGRRIKRILIGR
jgi:hypothetical protein